MLTGKPSFCPQVTGLQKHKKIPPTIRDETIPNTLPKRPDNLCCSKKQDCLQEHQKCHLGKNSVTKTSCSQQSCSTKNESPIRRQRRKPGESSVQSSQQSPKPEQNRELNKKDSCSAENKKLEEPDLDKPSGSIKTEMDCTAKQSCPFPVSNNDQSKSGTLYSPKLTKKHPNKQSILNKKKDSKANLKECSNLMKSEPLMKNKDLLKDEHLLKDKTRLNEITTQEELTQKDEKGMAENWRSLLTSVYNAVSPGKKVSVSEFKTDVKLVNDSKLKRELKELRLGRGMDLSTIDFHSNVKYLRNQMARQRGDSVDTWSINHKSTDLKNQGKFYNQSKWAEEYIGIQIQRELLQKKSEPYNKHKFIPDVKVDVDQLTRK